MILMKEFDTLEKVQELFEKLNLNGEKNSYFIAYKDTASSSGMVSGMEYPYDAVLVNVTEKGIAMIFLVVDGITLNFVKIEKLHLKNNEFVFIKNEDIRDVNIKKYALLNSSKKRISIKTNDKKDYKLYANINEPLLTYHNEGFEKFINQYTK